MDLPEPLHDWAKTCNGMPGISVRQHLLSVAFAAEALLHRYPHAGERCGMTPESVLFLAACHDVGKLSLDFLQKSPVWLERQGLTEKARRGAWKDLYKRPHPAISCDSLQKFLRDNRLLSGRSAACWSAVVGAHHGRIVRRFSSAPAALKASELVLEQERQTCLAELWERFGRPSLPEVPDKNAPQLWCMAGLVTLADWLGSDERFFPPDQTLEEDELRRRAASAVESVGFGLPPVLPNLSFADIFDGRTPYALQEETARMVEGPGIHVIEAPMGMGKTEAALWASYRLLAQGRADGIFFALPTQATSNRMFLRFSDFVRRICPETAPVQLIHGNSWLQRELRGLACPAGEGGKADACWFNTSRRSLFAPFGVGTADQAIQAVLAVRHFALRRFALAGKVVIVDEVHTYDMYTGTLIRHLCRELEALGCTVIILSATLTEKARCALLSLPFEEERGDAAYPRISVRAGGGSVEERHPPSLPEKRVRIAHPDRETALAKALELACRGAQILWVCNTVARAQEDFAAFRTLASTLSPPPDMGLLHSRFPFFRREELERKWMTRLGPDGDRRRGAILVSTQIVEQSVDLDADVLFSELAPADMLLQRMGRLWRHPRKSRPVEEPCFCLLREAEDCARFRQMEAASIRAVLGEKAFVYDPYVLLRTLEQWEPLTYLSLPSDIRAVMAATYEESDVPPGWETLYEQAEGGRLAERRLADMASDIWQESLDDEVILRTRLSGDDALMVLCTAREGRRLSLLDGSDVFLTAGEDGALETAAKLHRNAVRVPCSRLRAKPHEEALAALHLDGCLLTGEADMGLTHPAPGITLRWDEELGLVIRKEER